MEERNPILISLGAHIRALRKNRGYSQEAFANICGLDRGYLGAIERGERNISVLTALQIAEALELPLQQIFDWPK